jgi:hypothetical protein
LDIEVRGEIRRLCGMSIRRVARLRKGGLSDSSRHRTARSRVTSARSGIPHRVIRSAGRGCLISRCDSVFGRSPGGGRPRGNELSRGCRGPHRRNIFELYAEGLTLKTKRLDEIVKRIDGVSAAFIRELLRKAAVFAAIDSPEELIVRDKHLNEALEALLVTGGSLTQKLLGAQVADNS